MMLLTGCLMPEAQKNTLDTISTTSTSTSTLSPDSTKQISVKDSYTKGERITLQEGLPLFSGRKDNRVAVDQMKISCRATLTDRYTVAAVQGEWIKVSTKEQEHYWVPDWYASKKSKAMTATAPHTFIVQSGTKLYLTPGSATTWPYIQALSGQALLEAEWGDWYGVSIAPRNEEWTDSHPVLLWIKKKDIKGKTPIPDGWFESEVPLNTSLVRHLVDTRLNQTTTTKQVVKWLGQSDWKEQSRNLNEPGHPMRLGQVWRYERDDAHLLLTFDKNGKLIEIRWNMPATQWNKEAAVWYGGRSDTISYITQIAAGKSMPQTLSWKPIWVNQGDLNYTFLQAGTDDVLLMKGDDGGFSGMHDDDSYYALDRHTGKTLWRVHTGYGPAQAVVNTKRDAVTLFTAYDTDRKQYQDRVRHINLKDGKLLWEYQNEQYDKLNKRKNKKNAATDIPRLNGIKAARNVVVVDTSAAEGSSNGWIHVLNSSNGKRLWSKKLTTGYQLLNRSADEPYVLYREGDQLIAADPLTGRTVWQVKAERSTIDHIENNPYFDGIYRDDPFGSVSLQRWILLDDQWVLLDLNSGKKLSQFPARAGQQLEVLHDGRVLIRENIKGDLYGDYVDYTTSLFVPDTGKTSWVVKAKIERALTEENQLYVIMNGYPAALNYRTGETLWSAKESIGASQYPVNQGSYLLIGERLLLPLYDDLLVMDKKTGVLLGRIHDVVMGTPEHRDRDAKNGMINRIDDQVYVGSANGRFRSFPASDMEVNISP
ncbi:MAG: PQQ-binding-like beta-propeller repeat protein [Paenibacillus sp.]|uniref:outer membrane protein assembly factor BamB family protein n=1 Tax=Paenibacillus sp. TaxID=58172 RepID=UPI0025F04053|nr:PQQ-binding-like beta-propeller repeat protein [Paenibacillus sp.]MBR2564831.1 PQQ-binding-like beta-propeller repeat protein [Paenibacillus sp.]